MADVVFAVSGVALGALVVANAALIFARISHHDRLARNIVREAAYVTWLFKLGSDGDRPRERGRNERLRA
jgi:hypothetical protein